MESTEQRAAVSEEVARPIFILAQPRSGSSMTAGIFASHGVWFGTCRPATKLNPKGYFESVKLKQVMKGFFPDVPAAGRAEPHDGLRGEFLRTLKRDKYPGGPWAFKCTALYGPALLHAFPEAHIVCVFRDAQAVFASTRATRMFGTELTDDELWDNIYEHQRYMHSLVAKGAASVYTDEVVQSNWQSVIHALIQCGISPDLDVIQDFVEPSYWHYKR